IVSVFAVLAGAAYVGLRTYRKGPSDASLANQPQGSQVLGLSQAGSSKEIVFSSRRDGNQEIYVLSSVTRGQTNLTKNPADDGYPRVSPDGSRIAFASNREGRWQVYVMNADGTDQRNLSHSFSDDGFMDWSPDGKSLVFASMRDGNRELYIMEADGSNQRRLTTNSD